jgi:hypothetical protein
MPSIHRLIDQLSEDQWNYYALFQNHQNKRKPFVSDLTSSTFIEQYFNLGGKGEAMGDFSLESFASPRADHTASIFFLGLLLFNGTKFNESEFYTGVTAGQYDTFQFIWFITCLAHDAAFYKEHDQLLFNTCPTLEALKNVLNIQYDLTKERVAGVPKDLLDQCSAYFAFRHSFRDFRATDHGIYAGVLMFDRLVKNRRIRAAQGHNSLFWGEELEAQYAFAAATVAVHNMWLPSPNAHRTYRKYGLNSLINRKPITFDEAPLLYLLGLVDTIDPVKAYFCVEPKFVLKHVCLEFLDERRFAITVREPLDFAVMEQKAGYLSAWLNIEVKIAGRSVIFTLM